MAPRAGDEETKRAAEGAPEPPCRRALALMGELARPKRCRRLFLLALVTLMTPWPLRAATDCRSPAEPCGS